MKPAAVPTINRMPAALADPLYELALLVSMSIISLA
jgi:hypothetical protein